MRVVSLVTVVLGASEATKLHQNRKNIFSTSSDDAFLKTMDFKHRLRVCNAFANGDENSLDVFRAKEKLTEAPLPYKGCQDFDVQLKPGEKLDFRVGGKAAVQGSFVVTSLPSNDAVLFLAIYRHDADSKSVSFASHVFANLLNPQVAVIDTYRGPDKEQAKLKIEDISSNGDRAEQLRYDSVFAVNPGSYEAVLTDAKGKGTIAKSSLVAYNRESYVILRVGVNSSGKHPEELLVFPHSDDHYFGVKAAQGLWGMVTGFFGFGY